MTKPTDHDHDTSHDLTSPANDNGRPVTTPKGNALASTALTALAQTFKTVDTTSLGGRPVQPLMQFKSREGGIWAFGQRRTVPEPNSLWAVNPASFLWGWVCWGDSSKSPIGEKLVPISQPLPDVTEMPEKGSPWQQEMVVNLKCISGTDAGTEVAFKTNTEGGKGEVVRLIEEVRDRLNGQHQGRVSPIVRLENSSYPHQQYGKTFVPLLTIVDWMSLDGPTPAEGSSPPPPAPPASPPPSEQPPRRRRVG
jgi:hypothetical protein